MDDLKDLSDDEVDVSITEPAAPEEADFEVDDSMDVDTLSQVMEAVDRVEASFSAQIKAPKLDIVESPVRQPSPEKRVKRVNRVKFASESASKVSSVVLDDLALLS